MKFFIGANLKMNKTNSELIKYNLELEEKYNKGENIELMISPNFTGLNVFSENKNISLNENTKTLSFLYFNQNRLNLYFL
ncbi:MAG: triose-phosphate isomerase, partial [Candidatus Gracilibacteria bacterium]|nr:triose-phosphate isomerase [Candidatus Gracilibacteria bacterium]